MKRFRKKKDLIAHIILRMFYALQFEPSDKQLEKAELVVAKYIPKQEEEKPTKMTSSSIDDDVEIPGLSFAKRVLHGIIVPILAIACV